MSVIIPTDLPTADTLAAENISINNEFLASQHGLRPLRIAILNLMPTKQTTETQLLRLLSSSPLTIEVKLIRLESHQSKNTPQDYLDRFYLPFAQLEEQQVDGLIITGAPVETLRFEDVDYWPELTRIFAWSRDRGICTFHICWGAQAALYHHYGIQKYALPEKCFGIFPNRAATKGCRLLMGFDDEFLIPHSRHTTIRREDIELVPELEIAAASDEAGVSLILSKDGRQVFATGHAEYDALTLATEYFRDLDKGLAIRMPVNYFPGDDPTQEPTARWRGHATLLFSNWLHHYVYPHAAAASE